MDLYVQWALSELGLDGSPYEGFEDLDLVLNALKKEARRRGRILLGRYHPDRNPKDDEALLRFKAINLVLQKLEDLKVELPSPRMKVSHASYPAHSPYGPSVTTTTRRDYFSFQQEEEGKIRYDARKVVFMRPK